VIFDFISYEGDQEERRKPAQAEDWLDMSTYRMRFLWAYSWDSQKAPQSRGSSTLGHGEKHGVFLPKHGMFR